MRTTVQSELPFVEMYRAQRCTIRTLCDDGLAAEPHHDLGGSTQPIRHTSSSSLWNCDGEILHESDVIVRSHCQLIRVYRRGRRQPNVDHHNGSTNAAGADDKSLLTTMNRCGLCSIQ